MTTEVRVTYNTGKIVDHILAHINSLNTGKATKNTSIPINSPYLEVYNTFHKDWSRIFILDNDSYGTTLELTHPNQYKLSGNNLEIELSTSTFFHGLLNEPCLKIRIPSGGLLFFDSKLTSSSISRVDIKHLG